MISVMLLVLFIDEVLAFYTTSGNIIVAILIFSLFAVCVWKGELFLNEQIQKFLLDIRQTGNHKFSARLSALKLNHLPEKQNVVGNKSEKEGQNDRL